jgi:hypothetical protein
MIVNLKSTPVEISSTKQYEDDPDESDDRVLSQALDNSTNTVHSSYIAAYDRDIILRLSVEPDALPYRLRRCGLEVQAAVNRQTVISEVCRAGLYEDETELVRPSKDDTEKIVMSEKLLDAGHGIERAVHAFYNQAITTEFAFWTRQYAFPTA